MITALLVAIAPLAVLSAGCAGPDNVMAPYTTADDPLPAGAYPEIVLLDGLEQSLVKQGVETFIDGRSNMFSVQVTLRSVVPVTTLYEYRIKYFDSNGEQLNRHNIVWKQRNLPARVRETITERAMSDRAVRFEMEVRRSS
jgi:hypothetical protein